MKRTQLKDAFRNIKKQKVSWFAVVVIAMLSVLAYLGINFASRGLANNGNAFFDKTVFRDAEVISTLLVTPEDIDALKALDGVSDAEGLYQTNGMALAGEKQVSVDVVSLTRRINVPMLLEGRLPETTDECVLEKAVMEDLGIAVGDSIAVTGMYGGDAAYLARNEFKVTGIAYHADHASVPTSMPGNRYVIVLPEAFDKTELGDCFMKTVLLFEGTEGLDRFSDTYKSIAAPILASIEALGKERESLRTAIVNEKAQSALDDARAELADGKKKLEDARSELDEGWDALASGEKELAEAEQKLKDGKAELEASEKTLRDAKTTLDQSAAKLKASEKPLADALRKLNDGEAEYQASGQKLADAEKQLNDAKTELEAGKAELEAGEAELKEGRQALVDGYTDFRNSLNSLLESILYALSDSLGDFAERLDVSLLDPEIDPDDPQISLSVVNLGNVTVDMSRSLSDNLFTVVSSLGVPEDVLRTAVEKLGGVVSALADRVEVIRTFVNQAKLYYNITDALYGSIADATTSWDNGHREYIAGKAAYETGLAEYEEGLAKYNDGLAEYQAGRETYENARKTLDDGWEEYRSGKAAFDQGTKDYAAGEAAYQKGLNEYEAGLKEYEQGLADFEAGKKEVADNRVKLEEGEQEYKKGLAEYEAGAKSLADAEANYGALGECRWVILGASGNAGYVSINNAIGNIASMGITFALVFVLVGAIMIYATSGRIVEEQRTLIGATKALGLFSREIFLKYLLFGVTATIVGMILGVAAGYFGLQRIILYIYGRYYVFGAGESAFVPGMTAIVFAAGILLSALTVWFSCSSLLRSTATSLMQAKAPTVKRKSAKANRSGKSLYSRLILRNMLSDKKRLIVTIVSIAGCAALLTAGFTMRSGVMEALDLQFKEIVRYDLQVSFKPDEEGKVFKTLSDLMNQSGTDWMPVYVTNTTFNTNGKLMATTVISGDLESLDRFYSRIDMKTGKTITTPGDGAWINQRVAEVYEIAAGDQVTLYNGRMDPFPVTVSGAFRMYAGKDMILSDRVYESLFGKAPEYNTIYASFGNADANALTEALSGIDGVETITQTSETREWFFDQAAVMNLLAIIMIVIAGLMAYFILLNLTSMYIQQKKRELTIMRINGFTTREVINYVLREMIVTTVLGIVLGLAAGSFLGYQIIRLMESASVGFVHHVQLDAWLFAALITVVYSVSINILALRKVKDLKLTDVA